VGRRAGVLNRRDLPASPVRPASASTADLNLKSAPIFSIDTGRTC
jgi:hypothetical protein